MRSCLQTKPYTDVAVLKTPVPGRYAAECVGRSAWRHKDGLPTFMATVEETTPFAMLR